MWVLIWDTQDSILSINASIIIHGSRSHSAGRHTQQPQRGGNAKEDEPCQNTHTTAFLSQVLLEKMRLMALRNNKNGRRSLREEFRHFLSVSVSFSVEQKWWYFQEHWASRCNRLKPSKNWGPQALPLQESPLMASLSATLHHYFCSPWEGSHGQHLYRQLLSNRAQEQRDTERKLEGRCEK